MSVFNGLVHTQGRLLLFDASIFLDKMEFAKQLYAANCKALMMAEAVSIDEKNADKIPSTKGLLE